MSDVWASAQADGGRTYYYKKGDPSGTTTWDKPADFDDAFVSAVAATSAAPEADLNPANWAETLDPKTGKPYFYNRVTQQTTWTRPAALAQQLVHVQNAPTYVAGGSMGFGGRQEPGGPDLRMERRDDRGHGLPPRPRYDGPRDNGGQWEQRQDGHGFRGAQPVKTEEPEYATPEAAEEAYFKVLKKCGVSPDSDWRDVLALVVRERDFRAIKDPKDRKQAFDRYCISVRAQEKEKEKERKEKQRAGFREMLGTHEDIQHYTRWRTARPLIEREFVFKSVGSDEDRKRLFEDYILEMKKKHVEKEVADREQALQDLYSMLQALIVDPDTKWEDAHDTITQNERFVGDDTFRVLHEIDLVHAYEEHIKALERVTNEARQQDRRLRFRRERQARDGLLQLFREEVKEGKLVADFKWSDLRPLIAEDERYLAYLGTPGSSPLDLFRDVLEEQDSKLRNKRHTALDALEAMRYEMTVDTTLDDFANVMRSYPKTAQLFTDHETRMVYDKLMHKVKTRQEAHDLSLEKTQTDATEALRSRIKKLNPAVRHEDTFEDVMHRVKGEPAYEDANEDARRKAYDKTMRRVKERPDDHVRDRSRRDRDRGVEHRNGSRRDHDRGDRERRHRTRTPEIDAYKDERLKAQADRERQFRKPSFGLTPPRDRRDDTRYERDRRPERHDTYERERRDREVERERAYVSRADPRDKGRSLDYGDDDVVGSRPSSIHKRRTSEVSASSRRDVKRPRPNRRTHTPEPEGVLKEEPPALQSGSEEGEIEEV